MPKSNRTGRGAADTFSKLFFAISAISLVAAIYLTWQRYNPWRLSFSVSQPQSAGTDTDIPQFIQIPDAGIALPVFGASVTGSKWEATTQGVSYLRSSARPGQTGNSVFYGHNWPNLLGKLSAVKPGQQILVTAHDGGVVAYTVEFITVVTPDQTHIIGPSQDKRLTLYTCTGFFDTKRLVVTAIAASR